MKLVPLQSKEPLQWRHIRHCNAQANALHQEFRDTLSRAAYPKQIFEAEKVQPYLHALAKYVQSLRLWEMDRSDPSGQIPICQNPL